jgi:hypothetical protein
VDRNPSRAGSLVHIEQGINPSRTVTQTPLHAPQDPLFPVWRYHPFLTNNTEPVDQADITHRDHAICEQVWSDLRTAKRHTRSHTSAEPRPHNPPDGIATSTRPHTPSAERTDMVRTDRHQLRPVAGDSELAEAVKVLARAHKGLIWERTRHLLRLRSTLREFFPAALLALDNLNATDALELLADAPDPASAAALSVEAIEAALKRARRRDRVAKAQAIASTLRAEHLSLPKTVATAYAATVRAQVAILTVLNTQITTMEEQVEESFGQHPDAKVCLPQPARPRRRARRPGARRVRRRQEPLRRRQSPQELRRHQPDHPGVGQEEGRARPPRP